jgi:hypothetical protein
MTYKLHDLVLDLVSLAAEAVSSIRGRTVFLVSWIHCDHCWDGGSADVLKYEEILKVN